MSTSRFKEILQEMDLIGSKDENWEYFREDFDDDNDGEISVDKFDDDFKEIAPHIEEVIKVVLQMMDNFCNEEFAPKSLKD